MTNVERDAGPHARRRSGRHAGVHEPRAGVRRHARRPQRPLLARPRGALRAHRDAGRSPATSRSRFSSKQLTELPPPATSLRADLPAALGAAIDACVAKAAGRALRDRGIARGGDRRGAARAPGDSARHPPVRAGSSRTIGLVLIFLTLTDADSSCSDVDRRRARRAHSRVLIGGGRLTRLTQSLGVVTSADGGRFHAGRRDQRHARPSPPSDRVFARDTAPIRQIMICRSDVMLGGTAVPRWTVIGYSRERVRHRDTLIVMGGTAVQWEPRTASPDAAACTPR